MNAQQLHPDVSQYRIVLLNEWSHSFVIERTFDEESNIQVHFKVIHSGWADDTDGKRVFFSDAEIPVWVIDDRERFDDLLKLLTTIRDDAFPLSQPTK